MAELKPCPFCGGKPELKVIAEKRTILRCTDSQCYLFWNPPTSFHNGDSSEHAALRITNWWNRRYTPEEIDFDYGAEDE